MATAKQDYYETLGLDRKASTDEIKKAYKRLARKYHPDLNPGDKAAEEKFKNVQEAYDILSDDKKRSMFDQFGFYSDQGFPGAAGQGRPGPGGGFGFGGFDFSDLFTEGAGPQGPGGGRGPGGGAGPGAAGGRRGQPGGAGDRGFSDLFSNFFKSKTQEPEPERGSDLEYALAIDFWQSIKGTQVRLTINRYDTCAACGGSGSSGGMTTSCPQCNGSGNVTQMAGAMRFSLTCPKCNGSGKLRNACPACQGEGRIAQPETVEVRIPPGTRTGSRLRVAGKGSAGTLGAPSGDLYITVRVEDHPFFHREGDDILIKVPVSVPEACLGAKIEVPTVDGRALLKIPQGTQNGQRFRLREKGVFNARTNTHGDQIVEVNLQAPKAQDERTRELLRELANLHTEDPRAEIWQQV
ncbi:MAG: molecular chaperone DnaJ [Bryobacterales bacterium]|nr:molecular chaperone DnaJ [Bryobacterales bacterium]